MSALNKQTGASLIVSIIMLAVLGLLVVSAMKASNMNLRVAGNMQSQAEATAAAQQAIEKVISTTISETPSYTQPIDINNDGTDEYAVTVAKPVCSGSDPITAQNTAMADLPLECLVSGDSENAGIINDGKESALLCQRQQWDVAAGVTDARTGAQAAIHQGVAQIIIAGSSC